MTIKKSIDKNIDTIKVLLQFAEVAKTGNISQAAKKINIKQSNLSTVISNLEAQHGGKLFIRDGKGVRLTEAGIELFEITSQIEQVIHKSATFSTTGHQVSGDVRIWISDALGGFIISEYLSEFYNLYPEVHLTFKCSIEAPKMLHEADMAIVYEEPTFKEAVIISKNNLKFGLFASQKYLSTYGCPKDMEDLIKNHHICNRDNYASVWPQWQKILEEGINISNTCDASSMLLSFTKAGAGIALHPLSIGNKENDLIHLDKLGLVLEHNFWIISHKNTKDIPKVRALIDHIKEATQNI